MNKLEFGDGIEEQVNEPLDSGQWFSLIMQSITEKLFTQVEIDKLLEDPRAFILNYTGDEAISKEIYQKIVNSFFVSTIETLQRAKDTRQVLRELALQKIDEMLSTDTGSISAKDFSIIYKNLKKEE